MADDQASPPAPNEPAPAEALAEPISAEQTAFIMVNLKKPRTPCPVCGKETARSYYTYCSNACQIEFQYRSYIQRWKDGQETGLQSIGIVNRYIKKYLRIKYGNKCCICDWSEVNPKSGVVPLVADYIDGN